MRLHKVLYNFLVLSILCVQVRLDRVLLDLFAVITKPEGTYRHRCCCLRKGETLETYMSNVTCAQEAVATRTGTHESAEVTRKGQTLEKYTSNVPTREGETLKPYISNVPCA